MIRVRQVKSSLNSTGDELLKQLSNKLKIDIDDILGFKINKQSIDAREKENIMYVYEFDVEVKSEKYSKIVVNSIWKADKLN